VARDAHEAMLWEMRGGWSLTDPKLEAPVDRARG
jgi:hypothetical protein